MKLEDLKDKKILILGYGREGKATEQYLKYHLPEAKIGIADQTLDKDYLETQKDYDIAIKTPGIPKSLVMIPYTSATNIFFGNVKGTVIGVTGSKGKSTTASLIHHILQKAGKKTHLVGNIGNPMLSELQSSNDPDDIFVCELSSYQTEDLEYSPHISVITSLFPEHMDYHGSIEEYYNAKRRLLAHVTADDYFVYNPKYKLLQSWAESLSCKLITIGFDESTKKISLLGEHNKENASLAAAVARILGIENSVIESTISTFQSLPHRLQLVGTFRNITFYDDAISTAPEAAIAAIQSLSPIGTLMLGGEDRGFDFNELADLILQYKIPNLVLFPTSGAIIEGILKKKTSSPPNMLNTTSMKEAVQFAYDQSPAGSICILSTASPSYSLWKNFEEKGAEFQKFVSEIAYT